MEDDSITKLWINNMIDFIYSLNISNELKEEVYLALNNQYNLIRSGMVTDEIFGTFEFKTNREDKFRKECLSFFEYLYKVLETKGTKYFEIAIRYSLTNNLNISFLDNFIRFVVITNFNDIDIIDDIDVDSLLDNMNDYDSAEGSIRAYLGGFLICDISQFSAHNNIMGNYIDFYNFHSRENMTRTKVGTLLVKKLLYKMLTDEKLKDFSLGSAWIMKNNSLGKKFYEKNGFKFLDEELKVTDYHHYDKYIKVKREDYPELNEVEFEKLRYNMGSNFGVIIPSDEKKEVYGKPYDLPYIEMNGNRIDCMTIFQDEKTM